jgi:hypothetical protein
MPSRYTSPGVAGKEMDFDNSHKGDCAETCDVGAGKGVGSRLVGS